MRASLHNKTKPSSYTESFTVNAAGKEGKNVRVPGEVLPMSDGAKTGDEGRQSEFSSQQALRIWDE